MNFLFKSGNIIKHLHNRTLCVVTNCDSEYLEVIFFNSENCSGKFLLEDCFETMYCCCNYDFDKDFNQPSSSYSGEYKKDCQQCFGVGQFEKNIGGWKNATLVANTIQSYITKHVMGTIFPELSI